MIRNISPMLLLTLFVGQFASADEVTDDLDLFQELPVVLSASRLQQSAHDAPSSITVISREMIKATGVREIAEIFNFVPGFQVGYPSDTNPVVTYHGLSDQYQRRMQILIDGRSVYQPNWGGASWANLPLHIDDIERIEIIRGPNAASFGSNAFKATINIITQHSLNTQGNYLKGMTGSNNIDQTLFRHGGQNGDLSYRFSLGHEQDDGYLDPALAGNAYIDRWDYKYVTKLTFRSDYQMDINDSLHLNGGYTDGEFGDRKSASYFGVDNRRYFAQFAWDHHFSEINQTRLQFFLNKANDVNYFESVKLANDYGSVDNPLPIDRSEKSERYEVEFQHTYTPDKGIRLVWGGNARYNQANSYYYYHDRDNITQQQYDLFINAEKDITDDLLFNAGLMAERGSTSNTKFSPRGSINMHLSESQTIRLSASRAFRAPTTYEESADTRLNDSGTLNDVEFRSVYDLEPEEITSFDIGYIFQSRQSPFSADLRIFREEIRNIITPYPWESTQLGITDDVTSSLGIPIVMTFANLDKADIEGFETQLSYTPNKISRVDFTYTYIDISSTQVSHDLLLANYAYNYNDYTYDLSAPQHSASLLAYYMPKDSLQVTLAYHWVDMMKWNGGIADNMSAITYRSTVPPHERIDLRLGIPFSKPGVSGDASFNIRNLLNDDHYDFQKHNVSKRSAYITVTINFE